MNTRRTFVRSPCRLESSVVTALPNEYLKNNESMSLTDANGNVAKVVGTLPVGHGLHRTDVMLPKAVV